MDNNGYPKNKAINLLGNGSFYTYSRHTKTQSTSLAVRLMG